MIWFYFCKKRLFSVLGVAHGDPIFVQVGTKNGTIKWGGDLDSWGDLDQT